MEKHSIFGMESMVEVTEHSSLIAITILPEKLRKIQKETVYSIKIQRQNQSLKKDHSKYFVVDHVHQLTELRTVILHLVLAHHLVDQKLTVHIQSWPENVSTPRPIGLRQIVHLQSRLQNILTPGPIDKKQFFRDLSKMFMFSYQEI